LLGVCSQKNSGTTCRDLSQHTQASSLARSHSTFSSNLFSLSTLISISFSFFMLPLPLCVYNFTSLSLLYTFPQSRSGVKESFLFFLRCSHNVFLSLSILSSECSSFNSINNGHRGEQEIEKVCAQETIVAQKSIFVSASDYSELTIYLPIIQCLYRCCPAK
jgi:hypothetical protein